MNEIDELSAVEMNAIERQIESPARGDVTLSLDVARRLLVMARDANPERVRHLRQELRDERKNTHRLYLMIESLHKAAEKEGSK